MASSGATRGGGTVPTQGTAAARPANPAPGQMYWATDTGELSVGNLAGNAWQVIAQTSSAHFNVASGGTLGSIGNAANIIMGNGSIAVNNANFSTQNTGGAVDVQVLGSGLSVKEGANAKQGVYGPLVAGTLAVANTSVTANSRIFVCRSAGGTNPGAHYVSAQTAGTGFTVTSTNAADTGSGAFIIFEPG